MSSKENELQHDRLVGEHFRKAEAMTLDRVEQPCSLHELAPYIGKMRPELAAWAIEHVTRPGDYVLDPFCGSGTVLLEGALKGRHVIGSDLHPYAHLISKGKLQALDFDSSDHLTSRIEKLSKRVAMSIQDVDLTTVPDWVLAFYHPETLKELLAWCKVLNERREYYLFACLLAIAHHQRPGFLSFPASHTVPYLRTSKFPEQDFPDLYQYRPVLPRLIKKALRSTRRVPSFEAGFTRVARMADATTWRPTRQVDAIITSPPYMGQLHYARDNRLRLWLMGVSEWQALDERISPFAGVFIQRMITAFNNWSKVLAPSGVLAVLVGDTSNSMATRLDRLVAEIAKKSKGAFELTDMVQSEIPSARRSRKNCNGSSAESLLILRKPKSGKAV